MHAEATHEQVEEHLLAREQFMIGGRDTAIVVWIALAALVASFTLLSGVAGERPLPTSADTASPMR